MQRVGIKRIRSKQRGERQIDGDLDNLESYIDFISADANDHEVAMDYGGRVLSSRSFLED